MQRCVQPRPLVSQAAAVVCAALLTAGRECPLGGSLPIRAHHSHRSHPHSGWDLHLPSTTPFTPHLPLTPLRLPFPHVLRQDVARLRTLMPSLCLFTTTNSWCHRSTTHPSTELITTANLHLHSTHRLPRSVYYLLAVRNEEVLSRAGNGKGVSE